MDATSSNMRKESPAHGLALAIGFALAAIMAAGAAMAAVPPKKVAPSFDCKKARPGSIDLVICQDRDLSILDRTMGQNYKRAELATPRTEQPAFWREQREFIANRNKCMKVGAERAACIAFSYESRIQRLGEWIDGSAWRNK
jgi:uncharacterized protein